MRQYTKIGMAITLFVGLVIAKHIFHDEISRVCSWNIRFFGLIDDNKVESDVYYHYIGNYIKQIQPDILCLQEICSYKSIYHLEDLLTDYKLYVSDKVINQNKQLMDKKGIKELISGIGDRNKDMGKVQFNVFLVRKHISVVDFRTIHPKLICLKYIDKHTGKQISIYNCHFPSNFSGDNTDIREKVMMKLLKDIEYNKYKNVIITGDLNTVREYGELKKLKNDFVDIFNSPLAKNRDLGITPIFTHVWDKNKNKINDIDDKYSQIDYFFVSPRLVSRVKDVYVDKTFCGQNMGTVMSDLSDHCLIVMDIT